MQTPDELALRDLAFRVRSMRIAQKNYFQDRTQETLRIACDWEKKVDKAVKVILEGRSLFPAAS